MSEREKKSKRLHLRILSFVILAATAVFMIYSVVVRKKIDLLYDAVIAIGIMAFWVINDIVVPAKTGEFEDRTKEQMDAFRKYALLSGIGYGGLVFFAVSLSNNNGFYGALVYLIAVMYKRRYYDTYQGNGEESTQQEKADESGQAAKHTQEKADESGQAAKHTQEKVLKMEQEATENAALENVPQTGGETADAASENAPHNAGSTDDTTAENAGENAPAGHQDPEDEEVPTVDDIYRSIGKKH